MPCKPLWDKDICFFPSRRTTLVFKEKQKKPQSVLLVITLLSATELDSPLLCRQAATQKKKLQDYFIN